MENKIVDVRLINATENPEKIIEYSSRTCYNSVDKITQDSCDDFIRGLIKRGHVSCLEFAHATFEITGISRACQNQIVRSRLNSHLVRSQRYCNESHFEYVVPEEVKKNKEQLNVFLGAMKYLSLTYEQLILQGAKKEDARSVLPNACQTTMITSANFRQWRHFTMLRCDKKAQFEVRQVSNKILKLLYDIAPSIFEDLNNKFFEN